MFSTAKNVNPTVFARLKTHAILVLMDILCTRPNAYNVPRLQASTDSAQGAAPGKQARS